MAMPNENDVIALLRENFPRWSVGLVVKGYGFRLWQGKGPCPRRGVDWAFLGFKEGQGWVGYPIDAPGFHGVGPTDIITAAEHATKDVWLSRCPVCPCCHRSFKKGIHRHD